MLLHENSCCILRFLGLLVSWSRCCLLALSTLAGFVLLLLSLVQVHGKSGQHLTLSKSFCSCQAHYYEVVCKAEAPYVSCGAVG